MAIMLEALRVEDGVGMKVLEIGTGTGYNAALLTHRLGNDSVVTVDTEPDLIAAARARLIETGYEPHVVLADGTHGHPDVPASALADNAYRFLLSIVEPHLDRQYDLDDAGRPTAARVWSPDGTIAALHPDGTVTEAGPRSLWYRLEEAYRLFTEHDGPGPERYGLTVDHEAQHVWLDGPGGPCWSLRP